MKRLLIVVLTLMAGFASIEKSAGEEPEYAPKHVIIRQQGTLIEDRSGYSNVDVYLHSNYISVETSSIGDAEIYIVDSFGKVTEYGLLDSHLGYLMMDIPVVSGYYTIVICSDTYYGEGNFTIE